MDVPLLVLADYASFTDTRKLNLLGIFSRLSSKLFPVSHPQMFVVCQLRATPAESGKTLNLEIILMGEDGKRVFGATGPVSIPRKEGGLGETDLVHVIAINGIVFSSPGTYALCILVNGEEKKRTSLHVVQVIDKGGDEHGGQS